MYLVRIVEQQLLDLYSQGMLFGTVHTSIGQEACDVGIINALDISKDIIFSNHRAHGQFLAYCGDVPGLISEIMGKRTGVCGGIGGSQHLHKFNLYTNGIQGGIVPNAVGAALAEKMNRTGAVTVVFLGDGTMGQGTVYESFNSASLWSLPVLFVLEDNGIAQSTPKTLEHAGSLSSRASSFEIDWAEVLADDVFRVYSAASQAVDFVRFQQRPFFLSLITQRLGPHSKGDDTRSVEEIRRIRENDPLIRLAGQIPERIRVEIEQTTSAQVEEAVRQAKEAEAQTLEEFEAVAACQIA
jgi:TPP-dependent pyruvate/acetoin dehydrogenase alpha subunit